MAWNHPTQKIESESKAAKSSRVWWGLGAGLIVAVAAVAGVVSFTAGTGRPRPEKAAADEEVAESMPKPKQSRTIPAVTPAAAPTYNVVAEKLQGCKFLVNGQVKQKAKFYLCLFSASWCPPCRAEMPRIAKTYAETLKGDPDIELVHFSCDRDDSKAMAWAKEHDVKFPVVKPKGGNPLDLHSRGIPHLFIVKADGTVLEEGHPMRIFNEEKFKEIKSGNVKPQAGKNGDGANRRTEKIDGYTWSYSIGNGEVTIVSPTGKLHERAVSPCPTGDLVIPSLLDGKPVIGIGKFALCDCPGITSIKIPSSVTSIGECAFSDCKVLASVTIPSSVMSIGESAFHGCSGLTSVTIPSSVTSIGRFAFNWCSELTTIVVDVDNPKYKSIDNCLLSKDGITLIRGPGSRCVVIPKGVTRIGENVFSGCKGLTSVTIPSSVTSIGRSAFNWCSGLTTIVVDVDNPRYKSINNCLLSKNGITLIRGPGSRCVVIPKGVTSIGGNAFSGCKGLTSVTIPSRVTSIGDSAFCDCSGLTSVTIPEGVTSIGDFAFRDCSGLTSVTIPSRVTSIGMCAFYECNGLTSVTIPEGVTSLGYSVFHFCRGLTSVTIPSSVTSIGRCAFYGCRGLMSVTMRGERPDVEDEAFAGCNKLAAIHVPANAKSWAGMKEWQGKKLIFGDGLKTEAEKISVAEKLGQCDFLLNKNFKKNAKFYLCLFSASWCGPCRREMPRIAKTYAEMLKDDPDIELIHFSRDQNDEKALAWAKEHDVKFPVVKPKGGNPLDLHCNGIPHLFIIKANGVLQEEGHPASLFTAAKLKELKQ